MEASCFSHITKIAHPEMISLTQAALICGVSEKTFFGSELHTP